MIVFLQESSLLAKVGLATLSAALTLVVTLFMRYRARAEAAADARLARMAASDLAITTLQTQVEVLSAQVKPVLTVVWDRITKDLIHPEPQFAEMDALMHDLESLSLTEAGHARLLVLLKARITSTDPAVSDDEKESAQVVEIVMRKAIGAA